jgi:hypothetical protein
MSLVCNLRNTLALPSITEVTRYWPGPIGPGDIYEECAFHPILCTSVYGDEVNGISLIDATSPRSCSLTHCGVIKLTIATCWIAVRAQDNQVAEARRRPQIVQFGAPCPGGGGPRIARSSRPSGWKGAGRQDRLACRVFSVH